MSGQPYVTPSLFCCKSLPHHSPHHSPPLLPTTPPTAPPPTAPNSNVLLPTLSVGLAPAWAAWHLHEQPGTCTSSLAPASAAWRLHQQPAAYISSLSGLHQQPRACIRSLLPVSWGSSSHFPLLTCGVWPCCPDTHAHGKTGPPQKIRWYGAGCKVRPPWGINRVQSRLALAHFDTAVDTTCFEVRVRNGRQTVTQQWTGCCYWASSPRDASEISISRIPYSVVLKAKQRCSATVCVGLNPLSVVVLVEAGGVQVMAGKSKTNEDERLPRCSLTVDSGTVCYNYLTVWHNTRNISLLPWY